MLEWLARKLGLLPAQSAEQAEAERLEREAAARESNARTISAIAWSMAAGAIAALLLTALHAVGDFARFDRFASGLLFSTMWGAGWYGWRNPHTFSRSAKRMIGRK